MYSMTLTTIPHHCRWRVRASTLRTRPRTATGSRSRPHTETCSVIAGTGKRLRTSADGASSLFVDSAEPLLLRARVDVFDIHPEDCRLSGHLRDGHSGFVEIQGAKSDTKATSDPQEGIERLRGSSRRCYRRFALAGTHRPRRAMTGASVREAIVEHGARAARPSREGRSTPSTPWIAEPMDSAPEHQRCCPYPTRVRRDDRSERHRLDPVVTAPAHASGSLAKQANRRCLPISWRCQGKWLDRLG